MPEKTNQQSGQFGNTDKTVRRVPAQDAEPPSCDGKDEQPNRISSFPEAVSQNTSDEHDPAIPESKAKSGFKKFWAAAGALLVSLAEEEREPEPPPPPEKSLKESIREFIGCCRDREKRKVMLKDLGKRGRTVFLLGTGYLLLFVLVILGTIWALDFSEDHRIKFYPPDEVAGYLSAEHENLEAAAYQVTPSAGKKDKIPFDCFDTKFIETVKPVRIYADEYGIYLMTSKGWYNGEHGIFIAKDEGKMPPHINWGLIEGRIYTYAIYD